jgi:hypothetical protein
MLNKKMRLISNGLALPFLVLNDEFVHKWKIEVNIIISSEEEFWRSTIFILVCD